MKMDELDRGVKRAVEAWLAWVPSWTLSSNTTRTRVCRLCLGSPVIAAAGLDRDVPHAVQHALSIRIKRLIASAVDRYADNHLAHVGKALHELTQKKSRQLYRPREGLAPEYEGLDLDPQPTDPQAPFLFTISGLEEQSIVETNANRSSVLSDDEKRGLRKEIALADEFANLTGDRVCAVLARYRPAILHTVERYVELQVTAMLAELEHELTVPGGLGTSRGDETAAMLFADADADAECGMLVARPGE